VASFNRSGLQGLTELPVARLRCCPLSREKAATGTGGTGPAALGKLFTSRRSRMPGIEAVKLCLYIATSAAGL